LVAPDVSPGMSTHIAPSSDDASDASFEALCHNVLSATRAHLIALGSMSALAGPPLHFPRAQGPEPVLPPLESLPPLFNSPHLCVPIATSNPASNDSASNDPASSNVAGGLQWAVPLWSERGLIGALLLGARRDNSLYSHEEIEIARAACERLLDARAGSALAGRLMALQQQRLAETQVLDRRARRTLHDDILPLLHAAMLTLSAAPSARMSTHGAPDASSNQSDASAEAASAEAASAEAASETLASLAQAHRRISDLLREMPPAVAPQIARLGLCGALRRMANDELHGAFDDVRWHLPHDAENALRELSPLVAEVVFYAAREAMRNSARYGRGANDTNNGEVQGEVQPETALPLHLSISAHRNQNNIEIAIEDNGVGLHSNIGLHSNNRSPKVTQSAGGSGQGLILHGTMMAVVGGALAIQNGRMQSPMGQGTRVVLTVPVMRG